VRGLDCLRGSGEVAPSASPTRCEVVNSPAPPFQQAQTTPNGSARRLSTIWTPESQEVASGRRKPALLGRRCGNRRTSQHRAGSGSIDPAPPRLLVAQCSAATPGNDMTAPSKAGAQISMTVMRPSRPWKSLPLRVTTGRSSARAVAAISKSANLRLG
jgi:hypothetical protein